jgi:hypothetical protein
LEEEGYLEEYLENRPALELSDHLDGEKEEEDQALG